MISGLGGAIGYVGGVIESAIHRQLERRHYTVLLQEHASVHWHTRVALRRACEEVERQCEGSYTEGMVDE